MNHVSFPAKKKMANTKDLGDGSQVVTGTPASAAAVEVAVRAVSDTVTVPSLIPSFADACKLIKAPYSCLVMETHRRHIALPPMYLKKKKTGIQEELNAELLKYSTSLKGVPLAYDGIKVLGQYGDIIDDSGYIHLNIEASFVIFKPKKREKLVGVINKIGVGHAGCLVHGCFNACVLKPLQLSPEQWRTSGLTLGGSLSFEVFQLDADVAGVLLIRGRLEKSRVEELVTSFSCAGAEEQSELTTETDSAAIEETAEDVDLQKPKKKKKKRDKERGAVTEEDVSGDHTGDGMTLDINANAAEDGEHDGTDAQPHPDGQPEERKKKKKKKKNKRQEEEEEEEQLPPPVDLPGSDSSGYMSDKGSRKRKAQDDSNMPEAKKKRNK